MGWEMEDPHDWAWHAISLLCRIDTIIKKVLNKEKQ